MQDISSCTEATPNEVQIAGPQTDHLEPLHKAQDLALAVHPRLEHSSSGHTS